MGRWLPDLDEVAVGICDLATDLVLELLGGVRNYAPRGAPFGVHGVGVCDPDIEEAADQVRGVVVSQG